MTNLPRCFVVDGHIVYYWKNEIDEVTLDVLFLMDPLPTIKWTTPFKYGIILEKYKELDKL